MSWIKVSSMKKSALTIVSIVAAVSVVLVGAQAPQGGAGAAGQNPAAGQGGQRGGGGPGGGQTPMDRLFRVVKTDAALDAIIASDAKAEILGDRFGLNEGPV